MPSALECTLWPRIACLVLFTTLGLFTAAPAWTDEDAGHELATAVHERPEGADAVTRGTMTLSGGRRERVRESYEYRLTPGDGERLELIRFTRPANIDGTALLVHNHADGSTDQWLYLPAADRVRRISSENRGGSFVQSDLFFEDLEDRPPEKDTHRLLGDDLYQGTPVKLLESIPVSPDNSVYTRRLSWVHPEILIPLRIDLFGDGSDTPMKRFEVQAIERIQGYWTVTESTMQHLERGTTTTLSVEEVIYDQGLPRELFRTRALADPARERRYRP